MDELNDLDVLRGMAENDPDLSVREAARERYGNRMVRIRYFARAGGNLHMIDDSLSRLNAFGIEVSRNGYYLALDELVDSDHNIEQKWALIDFITACRNKFEIEPQKGEEILNKLEALKNTGDLESEEAINFRTLDLEEIRMTPFSFSESLILQG